MTIINKKRIDELIEKINLEFNEEIVLTDPSDLDVYGNPKTKKAKLSSLDIPRDISDLTDYEEIIPNELSDLGGTLDDISDGINYVKTENNFTDAEQSKLDGIESGAEVNVQSDWDEADVYSDSYILNKPNLTVYELSGNKNQTNGYAGLGSDGKISSSQLPAIAITDTFVVSSEAEMLALATAETGDVAVRTDINTTFILQGSDPSQLGDWVELKIRQINQYNSINIPIEYPEDGTVPPATAELYTNGNKKVRIRKFSNSAQNDITFDWATPCDMDTTEPIQFRVKGIKTEANGGEGSESWTVKFDLSGYSSLDLTSSTDSFGTAQSVTKNIGSNSIAQHSVFITEWSPNITISNLSNDSINQMKFLRDIAVANNYVHEVGIIEIEIKYTKKQF